MHLLEIRSVVQETETKKKYYAWWEEFFIQDKPGFD